MAITGKIDLRQIRRHSQLDGRLSPEGQSQATSLAQNIQKAVARLQIVSNEVEEGVEGKLDGIEVEIE
jgi:hypothetical protein